MLKIIEKYILESIQKENNSLFSIHKDTKLNPQDIEYHLETLKRKGFITKKLGRWERIQKEEKLNSFKFIELSRIAKACIRSSITKEDSQSFKIHKVYLSEKDEKIYQAMLYNIDTFLKESKKNKGETAQEKIIFWGKCSYKNLIQSLY